MKGVDEVFANSFWLQAQSPAPSLPNALKVPDSLPPGPPDGWLDQLLAFVYTFAHWLGSLIVALVQQILPLETPEKLIDPIGYLVLLTILLVVAEVAKKVVWGVVVVGWLLIAVRVGLEVLPK